MPGYPEWSKGGGVPPLPPGPPPPHPAPPHPSHLGHQAKKTSWLLPDYNAGNAYAGGGRGPPPLPMPPGHFGGGYGHGFPPNHGFPSRKPPHSRAAAEVSFDTSAKDPESIRARIFIGSLIGQHEQVSREDVVELCLPYGALRGLTFFKKQGYAFVQFEQAGDADAACRELNGVRWKGCVMDVHPVDSPTRGPSSLGQSRPSVPPSMRTPQMAVKAIPTTNYDEISYDTSQKDPALMRARVFIGSLNRSPVMRNDIIELCMPFGKITAVTLFKQQGYAFVQFESAVDAVEACEKLHGKQWRGNIVDVHLAMEGSTRKRNTDEAASPPDSAMDCSTGTAPKRAREAETRKHGVELICKTCHGSYGELAEFVAHRENGACTQLTRTGEPPSLGCSSCEAVLPNAWRMLFHQMDNHNLKLVTVDGSQSGLATARVEEEKNREEWWKGVERWMEGQPRAEEGEEEEEGGEDKREVAVTDVTIVCGACRLVTEDWQTYKEHKKKNCIKPRDQMEPSVLVCSMCAEPFTSAWKALFHLMDFHRMKLFHPDYSKEGQVKASDQFAKEQSSVEKRMKMWIESHSAAAS